MQSIWKTEVIFVDGSSIKETIVASSELAAKRAARKLAVARRPFLGTPCTVTVHLEH